VAAVEGQIKKLENITQLRLRRIDEGTIPTQRRDEICVGVIAAAGIGGTS
jgi:hypothetical protein